MQISQENLNFKTILLHCEMTCPFQFVIRKHDCYKVTLGSILLNQCQVFKLPEYIVLGVVKVVEDFIMLVEHKMQEKHLKI